MLTINRDVYISSQLSGLSLYNAFNIITKPNFQQYTKAIDNIITKNIHNDAVVGLKKLAFFNSSHLATSLYNSLINDDPINSELDFFGVSEIKFPKGGGMEIKFFDKLKAFAQLLDISNNSESSNNASQFITALLNSQEDSDASI